MPDIEAIEQEVDANFESFVRQIPKLLNEHAEGQFALIRHQSIVRVFKSAGDAVRYGKAEYEDNIFSVQEITAKLLDLGYFSHGGPYKDV
ncbi:MAG: hypothetical protein RJQ07_02695 [Pseudomonadales bacterium]